MPDFVTIATYDDYVIANLELHCCKPMRFIQSDRIVATSALIAGRNSAYVSRSS
ncbi:MAG: hypothetical protein JSS89_08180 [Bacteroidetes bacterium]|nr:hypothetical protein [Bacteroidota bacterium]